ncbi:GNAT family N-acetyltransferase [Aliiroseovarius lamellibrachiae]|uniref:GNAT family N-acetyltransferase n=1 Tax=Aliiroseovarius lamellibrachiae TaxID=1924933 RepID=UPI001BE0FAB9|nr:GNAT family N-acetyltransferase [Aliiroseovarius lamellibrachiae]
MIRAATPADTAAIQSLWNLAIRETLITFNAVEKSLSEVAQAVSAYDAFFVAEGDGQVLGFAGYGDFRAGIGYAHTKEHTIMLAPEARGKGLGRALMQAVEDHARAQKVHSMIAGVSGSNPMGEPFHTAIGYVKVGMLPQAGRKFDQWHDLVLMQKLL